MNRTLVLATTLLAVSAFLTPVRASAQSITAGELSGVVETPTGRPLNDVQLTVQPVDGGLPVLAVTDGDGRFSLPLLAPGEYELLAERLGYGPVALSPIPVRPDRRLHLRVTLEEAEGVVEQPARVVFQGVGVAGGARPGRSRHFGDLELRSLPLRGYQVDELMRSSSQGHRPLEVEGLPLGLGGFVLNGVPFTPALHGGVAEDPLAALLLPAGIAESVELVSGRADGEWPGAAGALLSVTPRSAPSGVGGAVEVGGYSGGLTLDQESAVDPESFEGAAFLGGSLLGDSASAWVFAQAQQRNDPVLYWPFWADGVAAELEMRGVATAPLTPPQLGETRRLNLGGRFDWRLSEGRSLDVLALYGRGEQDHVRPAPDGITVPAAVVAEDLVSVVSASGVLREGMAAQLRVGLSRSSRDYGRRSVVETELGDAVVSFVPFGGQLGDPGLPAMVDRSDLFAHGTLHYRRGTHQLKGGIGGRFTQHDRTQSWAGDGLYWFSGAADFGVRSGVFQELQGTATTASFSVAEYFVYAQDTWRVAPGLELTTGLRFELESLPGGDLLPNTRWRELTGIDNARLSNASDLGLVMGFEWDVQEQNVWTVRGDFAIQHGDVSPALLAEALTHDGRLRAAAAVGDVTDVTDLGPRLTILSPSLSPPATTRASMGLSRAIGTAALHLGAVLRETSGLPRRTDLNLPAEAPFQDQYGRPVHGELTQVGGLLFPAPGENRRFTEFEAVSAVSGGASSTYWGVTAALEKRVGGLEGVASYTYSSTQDDWLGASGAPLDALPPLTGQPELSGWAEGPSDFDVPHRVALMTELALPFAPAFRLGALYEWSSGRPFTPGAGRGMDANADGVMGNDPAFIDESIGGVAELLEGWDCLREFSGRFAGRNSCRAPDRSLLDAWVGVRLPLGPLRPELRVEALALDARGFQPVDPALYALDAAGSVTMDESTGEINVPLVVNPRFGQALQPSPELTRIRISLRMVF